MQTANRYKKILIPCCCSIILRKEPLGEVEVRYLDKTKLIQITAPIEPGSSGGALFNNKGEAIGITSSGYGEGNINFAVPIEALNNLLKNNKKSLYNFESLIIAQSQLYDGPYKEGIIKIKTDIYNKFNSSLGIKYMVVSVRFVGNDSI